MDAAPRRCGHERALAGRRGLVGCLRQAALGCGGLGLLWLGAAACAREPGGAAAPPPTRVIFATPRYEVEFQVEVAATPNARERGLMYRRELPEHGGMLFVFPDARVRTFWMKNTYVPLDIIFVDAQLRVVGVVRGAAPMRLEALGVPTASQYVIEIQAGLARRHGIDLGTAVRLAGPLPLAD